MSAMGAYPGLIRKAAAEGYMPYLGGERVRGGEGIHPQSIITAVQPLLEPFSTLPVKFAYASVGGITPPLEQLDRLQYNQRGDHQSLAQMFGSDPALAGLLRISRIALEVGRRNDVVLAGAEVQRDEVLSQGLIAISQGANAVVDSVVGERRSDVPNKSIGVYGAFQSNSLLPDEAMQKYLAMIEKLAEAGSDIAMRGTIIDWGRQKVPVSFSRRPGHSFVVCGQGGRDEQTVALGGLLGKLTKTYDEAKDGPQNHTTYLAFTIPQIALEQ